MNNIDRINLAETINFDWFLNNDVPSELLETIDPIIDAFYQVYPDGDLQVDIDERDQYFPVFVLKFDEFEITDGVNTHIIKDMFVKFPIKYSSNTNRLQIGNLSGVRTSFTSEELLSKYIHSHLSTRILDQYVIEYSDFCLGDSDLKQSMMVFNSFPTVDNFKLFLFYIDVFLKWESLEGGPYINIHSIKGGNVKYKLSFNNDCRNEISTIIDDQLKVDDFNIIIGSDVNIKNDELLEKTLLRLLPDKYKVIFINDIEYAVGSNSIEIPDKSCNIIFKQERITKIIEHHIDDVNIKNSSISKTAKNFVINKLETHLKLKLLDYVV